MTPKFKIMIKGFWGRKWFLAFSLIHNHQSWM